MRYRKLDANGDYVLGLPNQFWVDQPEGVAQAISTRLKLWQGEWFLDNTVGTPWLQSITGKNTGGLYDLALQQVILDTPGVAAITQYSSNLDHPSRVLTVTVTVITNFGAMVTVVVPFNPYIFAVDDQGRYGVTDSGQRIVAVNN